MGDAHDREVISKAMDSYFRGLQTGDAAGIPFADDVVFQGVLDEEPIVGSDAVGSFLSQFGESIESIDVHEKVIDGQLACATFKWTTVSGVEIEMCDYFRFTGSEIVYVRPYFDPRALLGE